MNILRQPKMEMDMDMSETYQATASIQLRTHPTHSTINFSELGKKLLESARNGDVEDVMELISTGAPFTTDWLGASPLHYASQYGHVDTVETLLNAGIAKDARTKIERTALHVAAQEGHYDTVKVLVNFGADVDSKDMLRMTPLHWAVQRGHRAIMELLLDNGADASGVNKFDKTPIDIAYDCGYHDFVPSLQNSRGRSKPKINPIEAQLSSKALKNPANNKNRVSKPPPMNRNSFGNAPRANMNIKHEIDDDMKLEHDSSIRSLEYLESMNKTNKKEKDMLQNVLSNGQTISLTEAGKLVLNNYKEPPQQGPSGVNSSRANKLITVYPSSQSNILLLSNNQNSTNSSIKVEPGTSPIKVVTKKPMFTEIKTTNGKPIPVNKLPFTFQSKPGSNQVIKRYVLTNTPATVQQAKDEEIKKLNEELKALRKEVGDYKELIIAKDLEIEKLKKKIATSNTTEFTFD